MSALPRAFVGLVVTAIFAALPAAAFSADPVRSADDFVDSVGVNVHMTYKDTAYLDRDRLVGVLDRAGIRHVRDGLSHNTGYAYDTFNDLAARGIKTTFIMGDPTERRDTLEQLLAELRNSVPGAVEAVEGPNEYSFSGDPDWVSNLRAYHTRLYRAIKGDPSLRRLPVLAPSLISWQDHDMLGPLGDALDFGNKHSYPGGDIPEANVDEELRVAGMVSGDEPVQVTESGYHNAVNTTGGHRPASEAAAATYIPRMYLEYFRRGIPRTFTYELIDEWADPERKNQESNFGLLRNDYSEKPAFRRLKNLITVLSDNGGGSTPTTPLDYSVSGAPDDLRQLVLQKRDGSHHLVLWRAVRVWDPVARRPVAVDKRTVSVQARGVGPRAELIDPARSTRPSTTARTSGPIQVSLGADPIVVKLPPASAGGPAPQRIEVPKTQRLATVLERGITVRCVATRSAVCAATGQRSNEVVADGHRALREGSVVRPPVRLTRAGRETVRRALRARRAVYVRVRASFGSGRVSERVRLAP